MYDYEEMTHGPLDINQAVMHQEMSPNKNKLCTDVKVQSNIAV